MSETRTSRWMRNDRNGVTLQSYITKTPKFRGITGKSYSLWIGTADVFKPKGGDRWVVRVLREPRRLTGKYDQYSALTLRDAMRMAKFLVAVKLMEDET